MSENRDGETKTDLVDLENKLNEAFNYAYKNREYYSSGNTGPLQSIGEIAKAIVEVRRQPVDLKGEDAVVEGEIVSVWVAFHGPDQLFRQCGRDTLLERVAGA